MVGIWHRTPRHPHTKTCTRGMVVALLQRALTHLLPARLIAQVHPAA